ncbi:hypothetical protein [Streptococcus suis]|uniref:hypothetical protein n=1 Tax=Streptococcus suis TaxID=1307 RepID=UPI0038B6F45E
MQEKKRKGYATQAQQREADRRYYHASEENRQKRLYLQARSTARSFIKNRATLDDLDMLSELISEERKKF